MNGIIPQRKREAREGVVCWWMMQDMHDIRAGQRSAPSQQPEWWMDIGEVISDERTSVRLPDMCT